VRAAQRKALENEAKLKARDRSDRRRRRKVQPADHRHCGARRQRGRAHRQAKERMATLDDKRAGAAGVARSRRDVIGRVLAHCSAWGAGAPALLSPPRMRCNRALGHDARRRAAGDGASRPRRSPPTSPSSSGCAKRSPRSAMAGPRPPGGDRRSPAPRPDDRRAPEAAGGGGAGAPRGASTRRHTLRARQRTSINYRQDGAGARPAKRAARSGAVPAMNARPPGRVDLAARRIPDGLAPAIAFGSAKECCIAG